MTYWQKLRFVYMLALLLTPRVQYIVVPQYVPYIEDDEPLFPEDDQPIEPLAYTALKVADLVAGVKALKT
jgi:hypothetical protein